MRYTAYFAGLVLLVAAAVVAGEMLTSEESFEAALPCTLALLGAGTLGFGFFTNFRMELGDQCARDHQSESNPALEVDGD